MSFVSILKKIGQVALGIERVAAPVLSVALPGSAPIIGALDRVFANVETTIKTVELNNPVGGGELKSAAVIADFEAGLETTKSILATMGKDLQYDQGKLQEAINGFVAGYNALADVKASFKVVDLPKKP